MKWDWSEILQSFTSVGIFIVACKALSSWRHQQKTQQVTEVLDELTDAVHEYIQSLTLAIQRLEIIHIAIKANEYDSNLIQNTNYPAAVRFIEKDGRKFSSELISDLDQCRGAVHKIRSFLVKGHVFEIEDFSKCQSACDLLLWQFDRLQAVYAMIGSPYRNWENPEVEKGLEQALEVTPESVKEYLNTCQVEFFEFMNQAYKNQYRI